MQVRTRRETSWKPLFRLLIDSKPPWLLYVLKLGLIYLGGKLSVYVIDLTGEIMGGNIFDNAVLWRYSFMSLLEIGITFLGIFGIWVMVLFDTKIQTRVWHSFLRLPMKIYEGLVPSTLISRVTTDSSFVVLILEGLVDLANPIIVVFLFIEAMLGYSTQLTWVVIPIVVLYTVVLFLAQNWYFNISYAIQDNFSSLTGFLAEKLGNIRLIKTSGTEGYEIRRGQAINQERFAIAMREGKVEIFLESFRSVMDMVLTGIVIIYGSKLISEGRMSTGDLISFYMFSMMMPSNFQGLLISVLQLQETKGATATVSEISNLEQEELKSSMDFPLEKGDLLFENVSFSYDGEEEILKKVNILFPRGKTTAIIGPSGSGKTSILKLLERFYEPDSGRILVGEIEAQQIHLDDWRRQFGYVIQNSPLLSGTVRENILYGANREVSDEELQKVIKLANIQDIVERLDHGLESDVGELGMNLSGGQRQRLAIARAIINQPEILLLDEATASMDAINESEITESLKELMEGKTLIVVAHHLKTITSADQIIVLEEGEVRAVGTHEKLYHSNRLYRHLYNLQLEISQQQNKEDQDDQRN